MSKKRPINQPARPTKSVKPSSSPSSGQPAAAPLFQWVGLLFLLVAILASLTMVLKHYDKIGLPGCGVGSGCDRAAKSIWGTVPYLNLPTSALGLAFFLAIACGWLVSRGTPTSFFKWIVRVGVLASLGFVIVILFEKYICLYCLIAHGANVAFWLVMERSPRAIHRSSMALLVATGSFACLVLAMVLIEGQQRREVAAKAENELASSTQSIIEKTVPPTSTSAPVDESADLHSPSGGFTGRWRTGPENAPIRIVIFSDYQCVDCRAFEKQVRDLVVARHDVSVSAKHFPLCSACNHYVGQTIHPNACWAARAAEAAGILRGNDGFWQMHHWLFDRGGSFTDAELPIGLQQLGYQDTQQFINTMTSPATLEPVTADIEEGYALGLFFTPMVFINGVELRGFYANPTALSRAVEALAATNPPPGSAIQDKPPLAPGKAVGDWRQEMPRTLPAKSSDWVLGADSAPIKVWVWGDYQSPISAELNQVMQKATSARNDIQYIYRHYPMDLACNPNMKNSVSPAGCWAARAAEAAGSIGGQDGFWKMHEWLMNNQSTLNEATLRQASAQLGFDADALIAAINSPSVQATVQQDITTGKPFIRQGVPTVYVNGKWVGRWKLGEIDVLNLIFKDAAP